MSAPPNAHSLQWIDRQPVTDPRPTDRVCAEPGCEEPGSHVGGKYVFENRHVRRWVCADHKPEGLVVLPLPADLAYALEQEAIEVAKAEYKSRFRYTERTQSIKTLAPSGHGEPIPRDRVKSWRWGT